MNEKKKLNLLPLEAKNKYANKYLKFTAAVVAGFFILLFSKFKKWGDNSCKRNNEKKSSQNKDAFFVRCAISTRCYGCSRPLRSRICLSSASDAAKKVL